VEAALIVQKMVLGGVEMQVKQCVEERKLLQLEMCAVEKGKMCFIG